MHVLRIEPSHSSIIFHCMRAYSLFPHKNLIPPPRSDSVSLLVPCPPYPESEFCCIRHLFSAKKLQPNGMENSGSFFRNLSRYDQLFIYLYKYRTGFFRINGREVKNAWITLDCDFLSSRLPDAGRHPEESPVFFQRRIIYIMLNRE